MDDIWQDTKTKQLIIVDYKSQAQNGEINIYDYLKDPFHKGYKTQMDFYAYLLTKMGYKVSSNSYFLVCNANRQKEKFNKVMHFDEYLIPYEWNIDWIEEKIDQMIAVMNSHDIPAANPCCRNCAYSEQFSKRCNSMQ